MAKSKKQKIKVQPELNIGLVGHVDHGKTTLTEQLSGKWTDTHSEELKRGITIKLGYANIEIKKCPKCDEPKCFTTKDKCPHCGSKTEIIKRISLVDAPGHESLMATMLSGATIMDAAFLLVAANEECPQPQTREHLMALEISGIDQLIVIQNKIDLVTKKKALQNYKQIKQFLKDSKFKDAPIVPISARNGVNVDVLIKALQDNFKTPKRNEKDDLLMLVARSFDINKPGTMIKNLNGGVLGGAIKKGKIKIGDTITLVPGQETEEQNKKVWKPIKTEVIGLMTGKDSIKEAGPGGSIAVLTKLDPSIVKSDNLSGNLIGHEGKTPKVWDRITLKTTLLKRVVGSKENLEVKPIKINEPLMLNVNSISTVGIVTKLGKEEFECILKLPIAANVGDRITISRRVGTRFRLIGYGILKE